MIGSRCYGPAGSLDLVRGATQYGEDSQLGFVAIRDLG